MVVSVHLLPNTDKSIQAKAKQEAAQKNRVILATLQKEKKKGSEGEVAR